MSKRHRSPRNTPTKRLCLRRSGEPLKARQTAAGGEKRIGPYG
jgi:hypothetical protein